MPRWKLRRLSVGQLPVRGELAFSECDSLRKNLLCHSVQVKKIKNKYLHDMMCVTAFLKTNLGKQTSYWHRLVIVNSVNEGRKLSGCMYGIQTEADTSAQRWAEQHSGGLFSPGLSSTCSHYTVHWMLYTAAHVHPKATCWQLEIHAFVDTGIAAQRPFCFKNCIPAIKKTTLELTQL